MLSCTKLYKFWFLPLFLDDCYLLAILLLFGNTEWQSELRSMLNRVVWLQWSIYLYRWKYTDSTIVLMFQYMIEKRLATMLLNFAQGVMHRHFTQVNSGLKQLWCTEGVRETRVSIKIKYENYGGEFYWMAIKPMNSLWEFIDQT